MEVGVLAPSHPGNRSPDTAGTMPGILSRLSSLVPTYSGIRAGLARPDTARPRPDTEERVPAEIRAAVGGRVWFLPYADSTTTGDTPEVRAAMRLMERDPYVKTGWFTQVLTVLAQEFQVHHPAARRDPRAQDQVDFVRAAFEQADGEMVGTGSAVLTALGSDGFSLCEKVWRVAERGKYAGKLVLKSLRPKDPSHLTLVGDEFRNVTGVRVDRTNETFPITDFVYTRYLHKFDEPMGMAPFRASYGAYWFRDTVRKLRVIRAEKADGLLVGTYTDPADKGTLESALQRAKTSTWMSVPEGVQVQAMDKARSSESDFKSFDESLREEILVGIAYAHLHILQGGVSDARGDTKVHKAVSDLGPWLLTYLVQAALNRQVIPDLIDYNFPGGAAGGDYPRVTLGGVTNQEILEQFQVLDAAQRAGFRPSRSHYAGVLTIQEADPEDPADQLAPPQQADPFGLGAVGGGGFGADPLGGAGVPTDPGDPSAGGGDAAPAFGEGGADVNRRNVTQFAWQPARSRTGGVKAIGTGENQGQVLYGRDAAAALAAKDGRPGAAPKGDRPPGLDRDTANRAAAGDRAAARQVRKVGATTVGRGADLLAGSLADAGPGLQESRNVIQLELADQPPAVARQIDRFLTEATGHTPVTAAAGVRSAARRLISWVGSLGVRAGKAALRGLLKVAVALGRHAAAKAGEAAWSLVGPPIIWAKHLGPPVAGHLALVLGGAALAASALYLPATVPFAVKLLIAGGTAGAVRYGLPRVVDRTTGAAIGKLENDSVPSMSEGTPPGKTGPAQRRVGGRFSDGWSGPHRGERGGAYWLPAGAADTPENREYSATDPGAAGTAPAAPADKKPAGGRRVEAVVAEAARIPVTEERFGGDPVDRRDTDEIADRMTADERGEMANTLAEWRDNSIDSSMREYDPDDDLDDGDREAAVKAAGWADSGVRDRAVRLVKEFDAGDDGFDEDARAEAVTALKNWYTDTSLHGVDAIGEAAGVLGDLGVPDDLVRDVRDLTTECEADTESALDDRRNELEESRRESLADDYDDSDDRRQYLRDFWDTHRDESRFAGGEPREGAWGRDGDGDRAFFFSTAAGARYKVWATPRTLAGQPVTEVGFEDDGGSFKVTGAGGAAEVFGRVTAAVTALLRADAPPVVTFTAAEPSRQKLYDRLVRTLAAVNSGYVAFAVPYKDGGRRYVVIERGREAEVRRAADAAGLTAAGAEVLAFAERVGAPLPAEIDDAWFRPDGWADLPTSHWLHAAAFAESSSDEVALAGRDGARAAQLLARAKADGRAVLQRLAGRAVARLLADPDPASAPVLFSDDELRELAGSLSATTATADLLGRARMLRLAAHARETAEHFAEAAFAEYEAFGWDQWRRDGENAVSPGGRSLKWETYERLKAAAGKARGAATGLLADPATLTRDRVGELAGHLKAMTAPEVKALRAEFLARHYTRTKQENIDALLVRARSGTLARPQSPSSTLDNAPASGKVPLTPQPPTPGGGGRGGAAMGGHDRTAEEYTGRAIDRTPTYTTRTTAVYRGVNRDMGRRTVREVGPVKGVRDALVVVGRLAGERGWWGQPRPDAVHADEAGYLPRESLRTQTVEGVIARETAGAAAVARPGGAGGGEVLALYPDGSLRRLRVSEDRGSDDLGGAIETYRTPPPEVAAAVRLLAHRTAVAEALAAGRPVRPEVLADYPELVPGPRDPGKVTDADPDH